MEWNWLSNGEGFIAGGREDVYLISVDPYAGHVTGVRLTRWRSRPNPAAWETALEAARNVIIFPLTPSREPSHPYVARRLEDAKQLADKYEGGEAIAGHPAWQKPPATITNRKV